MNPDVNDWKVIPSTEVDVSQAYTDRDLIELACRAPACPEWFRPDMSAHAPNGLPDPSKWSSDCWYLVEQRERCAQWPKAYARMVLESK